jgi:hypothetical protein
MNQMTNLKPADELKTIRDQIKALQEREAEIRAGLIDGSLDPVGNFAVALLTKSNSKRFDRKAAEKIVGDLSRFETVTEIVTVRVQDRWTGKDDA